MVGLGQSAGLGGQGPAAGVTGPVDEVAAMALKVCPKLLAALREKRPELVVLYRHRCEYLGPEYPSAMRLHNANEILFTAYLLGLEGEE